MTQLGLLISNAAGSFTRRDKFACGIPAYGCGFAAYLPSGNAWIGTDYSPLKDLSWQGRDLVLTGAVGEQFVAGPDNYADTPFNGDDLCERTGRCTIVTVARTAPGISAYPLSNRAAGTSGVEWVGIYQTNNSFSASARHRVNGDERQSNDGASASTRSGFEFLAGTFSPDGTKLYRSQDGVGLRVAATDTTPSIDTVGGPLAFRLGRSHTLGTDGPTDVALALFFDDVLAPSQVEDLLTWVTALLAACSGVVVAGGEPAIESVAGSAEQVQILGAAYFAPWIARVEAAADIVDVDGKATEAAASRDSAAASAASANEDALRAETAATTATNIGRGGPLTPTAGAAGDGWVKLPAIYRLLLGHRLGVDRHTH